jgi:hypothetical protein
MKKITTLFKKNKKNLAFVTNEVDPQNQWVIDGDAIATRKFDGTATAIINGEIYKRYDAKLKKSNKFEIGDIVSKPSGKPFKNGELTDEIEKLEINDNHPNKEMGAFLKNSQTIVSLQGLQTVGKFIGEYQKPIPIGAISCQEPDLITGHHPHWVKCDVTKAKDKYFIEAFEKLEVIEDGTYELIGEKIQGNPKKIIGHQLVKHGSEILNITDYLFDGLKQYLSNPLNDIEGIVFHHKTDERMCKCDFNIKR